MKHTFGVFIIIAGLMMLAQGADAQSQKIQLRLSNSMPQAVDAYFVRSDTGAPEFVVSIPPGETTDMASVQGMVWLFAIQRKQFQTYTTRPEPFQGLTLAPSGQQRPPQLAMQNQPPGGQGRQPQQGNPVLAQLPQGPSQGQQQAAPPAGGQPTRIAPLPNYGNQAGTQPQPLGTTPPQIQQKSAAVPAYAPGARPDENVRPAVENAAFGPSFSCRGGTMTPTEQRLCNNEELGSLDREIVDVYNWVKGQLGVAEQNTLRNDQRQWLRQRNGCGRRDDCLRSAYLDRRGYLNEYIGPSDPSSTRIDDRGGNSGGGASFPHPAKSWGGKVRSGPGTNYRNVASLKEGERISILEQSGAAFHQDLPWFKIRFRGRTGYQWGGVICPLDRSVAGTYQVCSR